MPAEFSCTHSSLSRCSGESTFVCGTIAWPCLGCSWLVESKKFTRAHRGCQPGRDSHARTRAPRANTLTHSHRTNERTNDGRLHKGGKGGIRQRAESRGVWGCNKPPATRLCRPPLRIPPPTKTHPSTTEYLRPAAHNQATNPLVRERASRARSPAWKHPHPTPTKKNKRKRTKNTTKNARPQTCLLLSTTTASCHQEGGAHVSVISPDRERTPRRFSPPPDSTHSVFRPPSPPSPHHRHHHYGVGRKVGDRQLPNGPVRRSGGWQGHRSSDAVLSTEE